MCVPEGAAVCSTQLPASYAIDPSGGFHSRDFSRNHIADVRWSLIGFLVETTILIVWIAVFQTQWRNWGSTGLNMLIYQPNTQWWLQ